MPPPGAAPRRGSGARGRWVVIGMVGLALLLGLFALRYRQFLPRGPRPTTAPV